MSNKLKYCANCKYSRLTKEPYEQLKCINLVVLQNDYYELSNVRPSGKDCRDERRSTGFFSICGIKGKKFESK